MNYLSLFTGIGGFELGIHREIEEAHCVGYSEIDKYAVETYERHFNGHRNYGNATTIDASELPDFELLVGGFPCQAFSVAGKRKGFDEARGTLFFDVARILNDKKPSHFILENVKGLLSHGGGRTYETMLRILADLGYRVEWQLLNSKDFGVPQNRERIYIVGHLRGECAGAIFPIGYSNSQTAISKTIRLGGRGSLTKKHAWELIQINKPKHSNDRVYSPEGISPTLNTMQGGHRQPFIVAQRGREDGQQLEPRKDLLTNTLTSVQKDNYVNQEARIRKLTPVECERLQGFDDNWTEGVSETQRYKQCGNAVTVNVVQAVVSRLYEHLGAS